MTKHDLANAIEAYAAAKSTANPTLIQFAGASLQEMLVKLPDPLPEKEPEVVP